MQTLSLAPALSSATLPSADPYAQRLERMEAAARADKRRAVRARERRESGVRLGWKGRLALDGTGLVLFLTAIVVWPPLSACRAQAYHVGLYAGDTVEKCTRRGVSERVDRADQRLKMLIRGSGH